MANWIHNSSVSTRCCVGKIIDELGAYSASIILGTRKKKIAFLVEPEHIDDFMNHPFYIKSALIEKKVLRDNRVWFSFDMVRLLIAVYEEGLC